MARNKKTKKTMWRRVAVWILLAVMVISLLASLIGALGAF